jgi:CBS domain containing-hemolysin-like protein
VGEIVDESDEDEEFGIEVIDLNTVEVDGRVMMDDLNEMTDWGLPESDDYETIAGYVLFSVGAIPKTGERLVIENAEIEILKASARKINSMRIQRIDEQDQKAG